MGFDYTYILYESCNSPHTTHNHPHTTHSHTHTQRQAQRFARTHNGRIASVFNCHTTHVVVSTDSRGLCPRTVKYLQGVLARIWVLSYQCELLSVI